MQKKAILLYPVQAGISTKKPADQSYIIVQLQINRQKVVLRVMDNGKGIALENSSRIFDIFFRASTSSTGPGIGLYIIKEAVNTLGGNATVASALGQGTTFRVELPNTAPEKAGP